MTSWFARPAYDVLSGGNRLAGRPCSRRCRLAISASIILLSLIRCSPDSDRVAQTTETDALTASIPQNAASLIPETEFHELIVLALDNATAEFQVTLARAERMNEAARSFQEGPSETALDNLKDSWIAAHGSYETTAIGRQLLKSKDAELRIHQLEYLINAWPVFPGYVDYIEGYPDSGVVNDLTLPMSTEVLRDQHGKFDLAEATLGFHVIEFLLWGQNQESQFPRPLPDFIASDPVPAPSVDGGNTNEQSPQSSESRRLQMLLLLTELLLSDLQTMAASWLESMVTIEADLLESTPDAAMAYLLDATATLLSEEVIVRSLYPLLNGDFQESLQSPFSHTSQNAVLALLAGVEQLLRGSGTETGVTLEQLLSELDNGFSQAFFSNFDSSKACLALLYTSIQLNVDPEQAVQQESEIVECINLANNMVNALAEVKAVLNVSQ